MVTQRNRKVALRRPDLAAALRAGHPWVYREALSGGPERLSDLAPGEIVDIVDGEKRFVARGYADPQSPIAIRVLTLAEDEACDGALLRRRLAEAAQARELAIDFAQTDAYRLLNGEGDYLPGIVCDVYAGTYVLQCDGEGARVLGAQLAPLLTDARSVYERWRGGGALLAGEAVPDEIVVREHGLKFAVDVRQGQKTGLFLDQRENRQLVSRYAKERTVLNCFAYTGGFSVAAARGGASRTVSVDTAAPALEAARRNFCFNGMDPGRHELLCEDAFTLLDRTARRGERFDVVVLDPPSFAPNERALQKALGAYRDLQALGLRVLAKGGVLATASCSSHVTLEAFLQAVRDGAARARRRLRLLHIQGAGPDHPLCPAHPEGRYLKFVLGVAA